MIAINGEINKNFISILFNVISYIINNYHQGLEDNNHHN
jgi:hypothetical protein